MTNRKEREIHIYLLVIKIQNNIIVEVLRNNKNFAVSLSPEVASTPSLSAGQLNHSVQKNDFLIYSFIYLNDIICYCSFIYLKLFELIMIISMC